MRYNEVKFKYLFKDEIYFCSELPFKTAGETLNLTSRSSIGERGETLNLTYRSSIAQRGEI